MQGTVSKNLATMQKVTLRRKPVTRKEGQR